MIKHTQPEHHFLVASIFEWQSGTDLHTIMKRFDKEKQTYWVWYVPAPADTPYNIEFYQPQVEGSICLQEVEFNKGKRVSA